MSGKRLLLIATTLVPLALSAARAADPFEAIGRDYGATVRPLLARYCLSCHSADEEQGDLDLERFADLGSVRKAPRVWLKVVEMLDNGEMPPKKKPQPTAAERAQLRGWAAVYLDAEARAGAGDPGAVVLRRLSNVEYDNTVRDLTGIDLKPAREFPVDGAAGEGFTNVGEALVMSPAMLDKYAAAAKGIAAHAVLLPETFRFSAGTTRRDWTDEIVGQIRNLYRTHTDPEGATRVNLQGLVWDTNAGGRIPLEPYLSASLVYRDRPASDTRSIAAFAAEKHLSPKYLKTLLDTLSSDDDSPLLGLIRARWRASRAGDVVGLAAEIRRWQAALTRFGSVAHFKPWMSPVDPLAASREIRLKLPETTGVGDVTLRLVTGDAGDGPSGDVVAWRNPRLEMPGRAPIPLRDLRDGLLGLTSRRRSLGEAASYLAAAEDARDRPTPVDVRGLAKEKGLDPAMLDAWLGYLGVVGRGRLKIDGLFAGRIENGGGSPFVKGWGTPGTPNLLANGSGGEVHVPGTIRPHAVAVHPAPTLDVGVGWLSPISGMVRVEPRAVHAHPACGNGVSWSLELRREGERRRLASGRLNIGGSAKPPALPPLRVVEGDLISLLIGARDGNHACDLTEVDLTIVEVGTLGRSWNLAREVADTPLAGNPHPDAIGNRSVWHFYQEAVGPGAGGAFATIPAGSLLDRWRDEPDRAARDRIAADLGRLLAGPPPAVDSPNATLHRQLTSLGGPLLGKIDLARLSAEPVADAGGPAYGLPRSMFAADGSLMTRSSSTIEVRLPADLAAGREFAATASLAPGEGDGGSVQVLGVVGPPPAAAGLLPDVPVLVREGSPARARFARSLDAFRRVFPAALCYAQIVPVDEVVTLVLFHREDEPLSRLILDDAEARRLDRLWDDLRFVSQDALKVKEAYGQFMEYVTQDGDVRLFEPLRLPIADRAEALRQRLLGAEPRQVDALVAFASVAYRRPLTDPEAAGLRDLYAGLRRQGLDHDAAIRLGLTRVLMAPSFLYKAEESAAGEASRPVSDWELASRLSYFLWSSMPDDELRWLARAGTLHRPAILEAQTRRMLGDDRVRSLATEFACQWIDIRGFDTDDEKSERVFPTFSGLRGAMYEEGVRFFAELFRADAPLLDVLDADYTFVNGPLARHYGLPGVDGPDWRRVEGVRAAGRGGVLGMAALLSKQSGASRTSPILRGNWLSEMLLGEKLPKPPKNVPQLPESELDTAGKTIREITEAHRAIESCAKCHDRIDPFGFALEGFDAIGRRRQVDLAGRPIDTKARLKDGTTFAGIEGLREYLLTSRRDAFVDQFCRKLLGYALGRSVQISDGPLVDAMKAGLAGNGYHVQSAILTVVRSPQFLTRRGLDSSLDRDESSP